MNEAGNFQNPRLVFTPFKHRFVSEMLPQGGLSLCFPHLITPQYLYTVDQSVWGKYVH